jgi:mono/diheme cytochrome c family protein
MRVYNLTRYLESIQDTPETVKPARQSKPLTTFAHDITPTSGASMYRAMCASCHGVAGTGGGAASANLKTPAPDLTRLTASHGGKFPSTHVANVLGIQAGSATAHGSKEMPVWGNVFRDSHEQPARVQLRIKNLSDYLKSIQKP